MLAKQLQGAALATIPAYIEDIFSTYLYTGNGSTQTITNGIDLSGKGGLVWMKGRSGATDNALYDTARGATFDLASNTSAAQTTQSTGLTSFGSTGFSIGALAKINTNAATYASWTFRKQAKFFDVVTWTGDGIAGRTISHNLGSVPGCIIVKRRDNTGNWAVYHRANGATPEQNYLVLNDTLASQTLASVWNNTAPTSTNFTVGTSQIVNANTGTYVAYLFAHDAGGFGAAGSDNVISCGSFTTDGSGNATVSLGYEPQWILLKKSSTGAEDWYLFDSMRGIATGGVDAQLNPNLSAAEASTFNYINLTATGFGAVGQSSSATYIYIAIRRGPMKTPTSGTSVFGLSSRSGTGANATVTGSAGVSDAVLIKNTGAAVASLFSSRLTGTGYLVTSSTAAEVAAGTTILQANPWDVMDGVKVGTTSTITNATSNTYINYLFDRAPGFFDVVCYTGTGAARTISHNLGVAPEMMIMKARTVGSAGPYNWIVYHTALSAGGFIYLNLTNAGTFSGNTSFWNGTAPTSSVFSLGGASGINENTYTYVAYLFATVTGVSKVGSYTGTGTTLQVDCGFTAGSRFVMIKRTDSTGDWYVWDTARGIVSGNDPRLSLNTTAAEVTTDDTIDPDNSGFIVNQAAATNVNVNNATYIFLAIA